MEDFQKLKEILTLDTLKNNVKFISSKFNADKEMDHFGTIKQNFTEKRIFTSSPHKLIESTITTTTKLPPLTTTTTTTTTELEEEKRGTLTCEGKQIDSEVIYWKIVEKDKVVIVVVVVIVFIIIITNIIFVITAIVNL